MHAIAREDGRDMLDAQTSARLSTRLRMARQNRGMTLKVLAEAAGCSESLLSKIENGNAFPSLPMLHRLVQSLDTNMGWMFEDTEGREPIIFRSSDRPVLPLEAAVQAIRVERVIPDAERHLLQCNIYRLGPGAASTPEHRHAGEEAGYVLDGQVELTIDGRAHRLSMGDAFAFRSDRTHSFRNIGPKGASIFWVNTSPVT